MPVSEAVVKTDRAQRYLAQLSKHLAHGPGGTRTEFDGDRHLVASVGTGALSMQAEPMGLWLRAEAPDTATLDQIQRSVAGRLELIGRRDGLLVHWSPAPAGPPDTSPPSCSSPIPAASGGAHDHHNLAGE